MDDEVCVWREGVMEWVNNLSITGLAVVFIAVPAFFAYFAFNLAGSKASGA